MHVPTCHKAQVACEKSVQTILKCILSPTLVISPTMTASMVRDPALVTKLYTCGPSRPRKGTSGSAVYALYERGSCLGWARSLVRHLVKVAEERVAEVDRQGA